jgi:3-deoxy-D-manno-octulosonic-acid transferase
MLLVGADPVYCADELRSPMYLAYSFLLTLGFLVLLPRFIFDAFSHGKYVAGFRERRGSLSGTGNKKRPVIWLHCVSVGETQAARPLVQRLRKQFPQYGIVVSTITLTGQKLARDVFKDEADTVFYFPFDWAWAVRRTLAKISPVAVLIMETELWPNFLRECKVNQIPVALVNGRISRQSFRRYRLIKPFFKRVLSCVSLAVMQTGADAERMRTLGFPQEKLFTSGNLKFDSEAMPGATTATANLRERFNLVEGGAPLILAASTHGPEEKIMLECLQQIRTGPESSARLMLAPRHPERFPEVASLLQSSGLSWTKRTNPAKPSDSLCDVILLDTIGELPAAYSLAAIVFVGGSIVNKGGHNVLEPAAAGACVVTGAYTDNFEAIVNLLNEYSVLIQLPPLQDGDAARKLAEVFSDLLLKPELRKEMGNRAKQLVADNRGAADRTIELIAPLLFKSPAVSSGLDPLLAKNAHTS